MHARQHPASSSLRRAGHVLWVLGRDAVDGWFAHQAARTGAALAFYTVFSLAPVLLLSIAIAGFFFGTTAASGEIIAQIAQMVGPAAAEAVRSVLVHASRPGAGVLPAIVSIVTLVLGANTALAELKSGLDQIWEVPPSKRQGLWYLVRTRLLTVGMILALGFLLLVSLVLSAALAALQRLSHGEHLAGLVLDWVNWIVSLALVTALFATIYKLLPGVRIAWRDVAIGAVVTALLFTLGKFAIGAYIGNSGIASAYGAAGSVIVVLLWVYYSAQILLFGAEFTRSYACRYGSQCGGTPVEPARNPAQRM